MRYLGEDEITHMMGIGYLGEVRMGPDGSLYQWVAGYDGLGNPVGFWRALRRRLRPFVRRALPIVQRVASMIPHPYAQAVATGVETATPWLRRAGISGYGGLGALYQAPDGTLYHVQGLAEDEALYGFAEDEELSGLAEDEALYGFAEDEELSALAEDEALYGFAEDEDLQGFAEDEALYGFAEDEELSGLAEDEALYGFAEDEELSGLAEDEALYGFAEDEDLQGFAEDEELLGQGYVQEDGVSGLDAYVPDRPEGTRWFTPPATPPELWRPLW